MAMIAIWLAGLAVSAARHASIDHCPELRIEGLAPGEAQFDKMGIWKKSSNIWAQHSVYFKADAASSSQSYLYFHSKNNNPQWIISDNIGQSNGYAYVNDAAENPDSISGLWSVSTGSTWRAEPELSAACAGDPTPVPTTFLSHPDSRIRIRWQQSALKPRSEDLFIKPSKQEAQINLVTWACMLIVGLVAMVLSVSTARSLVLSEAESSTGVELQQLA
jgi:hypothetical protein